MWLFLQFEEKHHTLLVKVIAEQLQCSPSAIVDFELNVCDTQAGVFGGMLCIIKNHSLWSHIKLGSIVV